MTKFKIATFYKFTTLENPEGLRADVLAFCQKHGIRGTIVLASEGINATVAGCEFTIHALLKRLRENPGLATLKAKFSDAPEAPFRRMKVRLKKEIVTMGADGVEPAKVTGRHIPVEEWNEVISDPGTLLLDTRNIYETEIGTFEGALVPNLESFRDFPKYVADNLEPEKHKNIAMFCTGGIRCEKASAYLLQKGFKRVVQLDGGILDYIEKTPKDKSKWRGDCYVFDARMAVDHELKPGDYVICPTCRWPVASAETSHPDYEEGVTCKHCKHSAAKATIVASRERKKQMDLAKERGEEHLG